MVASALLWFSVGFQVRGALQRSYPPCTSGLGAGVKAGFLEEDKELGRRGRTVPGAPGDGGISEEFLGHRDSRGWSGRFGLCPQARRPRLQGAERRTVLNTSLRLEAGQLGPPSPRLLGGAAPATVAGAVAAAHLAQVSRSTLAAAQAPGLGSR